MSSYIFTPSPTFGVGDHPFVTWDEGFTPDEVARIIKIGEARMLKPATIDGGTVPAANVRVSKTSWLANDEDTLWLYDRLAYIARRLNGQFYRFDLHGFCEDFQYTLYDGEDAGHYNWHQDSGANTVSPRKLSMVVQLTDPGEYEGGDLQIMTNSEPTNVDKALGKVVAFPSYNVHRVTPVTKGVRRTLVVWITGEAFR